MDKKIERKPLQQWWVKSASIGLITMAATVYGFHELSSDKGRVQAIALNTVTIKPVQQGTFLESLSIRGQVTPKNSIFLDTIQGGRVEEKLAEQGAFVNKGQPLLRLTNSSLQMEVMSREAQVAEQLNFLRNTQMEMETNRLNLRRDLLEIDLKITHLKRKIRQYRPLVAQSVLAKDTLQEALEDLAYYESRKKLTLDRQQQEKTIRQTQISQLQDSANMLQSNLQIARKNLDDLIVKSPITGYLSEFEVEVGESKPKGARLGRVDRANEYKLTAALDEFYLDKVYQGLPVKIHLNNQIVDAEINKVDNRVVKSQFAIEIDLKGTQQKVKRGQSIDIDLILGSQQKTAVLLDKGAFFSSTGGKWVFVIDEKAKRAQKRFVTLGKKNKRQHQVLSGLEPGERVITSSYQMFNKADTLKF